MMESNNSAINVDQLIKKIREEVAHRQPISERNLETIKVVSVNQTLTLSHIENLLHNAQLKSQIRTEFPKKLNRFPFSLSQPLQKLALKLYSFLFKEQRAINFSLIEAIRESLTLNRKLIDQVMDFQGQVMDLQGQVMNLQGQVKEISAYLTATEKHLNEQLQAMDEHYIKNDSYLKNDLTQQKRLITLFLEAARQRLPESFTVDQLQTLSNEEPHQLDAFYVAFEDQFRGSREEIRNTLNVYLPVIEDAKLGTPESPILDVGCGRGEWLELLRESGYSARGIDINRVMLEQCNTIGLEVIEADAIAYLQNLPDHSLGAVTGFHLIEHLQFAVLMKLFDETMRVLQPGGLIIFETPNPRNLFVGSGDFYRDPTHVNPIHPDTIAYIAILKGFMNAESYFFAEQDNGLQLLASSNVKFDTLESYLSISRDFALIGYKP
ncbi:MAG: class I SAM-dependent methyltransferase [Coleofasciculus sp. B1-GNL1-01]|uniref:class I SAM-dependent methyltransferase n=1 Tax=Coleofasciculus sp. B1-GNL1-01 TaxID=3068484 RepID=UPI0032F65837